MSLNQDIPATTEPTPETPAADTAVAVMDEPAPPARPARDPEEVAKEVQTANQQRRQQQDSADDAWFGDNEIDENKPAGQPGDNAEPPSAEKTDTAPKQPAPFTPDELKLLERNKLAPEDVEAIPAVARTKFLANLAERVQYADRITDELNKLRGGQPPAAGDNAGAQQQQPSTPPAPAAPAAGADAWAAVNDAWTEEGAKPIRNAVEATIQGHMQQHVAPALQAMQVWLERQQVDAALESIVLPEGVDAGDEQVRQRLIQAAAADLSGKFDLLDNNWTHAIPRAAMQLYGAQVIQANQARKAKQATASRRGSVNVQATAGGNTRPKLDAEALDDALAEAALAGKPLDDLLAMKARRGA